MVITCHSHDMTDMTCILEDPTINGYFLNSDEDDTGNKVIKCTANQTSPCSKLSNVDTCNEGGCIKVDNAENPTTVTLCLTDSCTNNNEIIVITDNNEDVYKTITSTGFPGTAGSTPISIKVGKDGSVILLEDIGLPCCPGTEFSDNSECLTNASDVQYCIHEKKIYKITIGENGSPTFKILDENDFGPDEKYKILYINNVYEEIVAPTETTNDIMAYICTFIKENEEDQNKIVCEIVKGYIINGTKYIQCSGWKREGCKVNNISSITSCPAESDGEISNIDNTKVLCFNENKNIISTSPSTYDYIAFKTVLSINPIYGIIRDPESIEFLSIINESSFSSIIISKAPGKKLILI